VNPIPLRVWSGGRERTKGVLTVVVGIAAFLALGDDEGVVMCPFRRCTGGYCPLCGTTRAAAALVRLDLPSAWARHPLVVLFAAQIAVVAGLRGMGRTLSEALRNQLLVANGLVAVSIWGMRMAAGHIPAPTGLRMPF
jgi:hypothetical protein